ncbi:MAG: hypothetical protein LBV49_04505 [Azonexus sp.]|jgi:hypothetical protein|nr:hypothetical protein [Azonexus sp.]
MIRTLLVQTIIIIITSRSAIANDFSHDGIRVDFPSGYAERKITHLEDITTYQLTRGYGSGSPQEVIEVFIHIRDISNETKTQARIKEKGAAYEAEICLAVAARVVFPFPEFRIVKDLQPINISGNKAVTATVAYAASYAASRWVSGTVNDTTYCTVQKTREIEFKVLALPDAPVELLSSTLKAIEDANIQEP